MQKADHNFNATTEAGSTVHSVARINAHTFEHQNVYRFAKRAFDFFASLVGLIILSPVFLIVAVAIKLDDPKGKVFFSQNRVGKDEELFRMYKFRSMCFDAEAKLAKLLEQNEVNGAMFKMKDDPRVTRVGRVLRKTSLDELPQLINVLVGNMSLVGPRPPLPREVAEYTPYDKQRLTVVPGCTGLWQASKRNSVGFEEMVELDLQYIEHRSFGYDLKLIFMTVMIMVHPSGY